MEYIDAYRARMETVSWWGYNLAQCIAAMVLSSHRPQPWEAFPGWIPNKQDEQMEDDAILAVCKQWCG